MHNKGETNLGNWKKNKHFCWLKEIDLILQIYY